MRIFIGIRFQEEVRKEIYKFAQAFKKSAIKGNFTHKENFHLTLVFLGEVDEERIVKIEESMNKIDIAPFSIELNKMGKFKGRGGDIYWIGFKESEKLQHLYEKLSQELRKNGFQLEERPYTPHLTLGRKVILKDEIDLENVSQKISKLQIEVSEIHLMLSHRLEGKLTYTPIRTKIMQS